MLAELNAVGSIASSCYRLLICHNLPGNRILPMKSTPLQNDKNPFQAFSNDLRGACQDPQGADSTLPRPSASRADRNGDTSLETFASRCISQIYPANTLPCALDVHQACIELTGLGHETCDHYPIAHIDPRSPTYLQLVSDKDRYDIEQALGKAGAASNKHPLISSMLFPFGMEIRSPCGSYAVGSRTITCFARGTKEYTHDCATPPLRTDHGSGV